METFRTSTLQMLARLQKGLGVKFIIGLNFLQVWRHLFHVQMPGR